MSATAPTPRPSRPERVLLHKIEVLAVAATVARMLGDEFAAVGIARGRLDGVVKTVMGIQAYVRRGGVGDGVVVALCDHGVLSRLRPRWCFGVAPAADASLAAARMDALRRDLETRLEEVRRARR